MIWAFLGYAVLSLGAVVGAFLDARSARKETMRLRDVLDSERSVSAEYKSARDVEVAAHAVTSAELKEATQRLAVAEAQRNEVMRREAERLKESDVHTVADVLSDSLAQPWKPVHGVQPSQAADDNSGAGDRLIDPSKV